VFSPLCVGTSHEMSKQWYWNYHKRLKSWTLRFINFKILLYVFIKRWHSCAIFFLMKMLSANCYRLFRRLGFLVDETGHDVLTCWLFWICMYITINDFYIWILDKCIITTKFLHHPFYTRVTIVLQEWRIRWVGYPAWIVWEEKYMSNIN
jgi:hypothetical protein